MPDSFAATSTLASFLFALTRVTAAIAFVPLPGFRGMAASPKAFLALAITLILLPRWPAVVRPGQAVSIDDIAWSLPAEAALGVAVGLAVAWVLEVFVLSMQFLSVQAGYSYASTIDPSTQADAGVLQVFAQLAAGMLFFRMGMDRWLIEAFAASLEPLPAGSFRLTLETADQLGRWTGHILSLSLRLALPIVGFLMLVDVSLALLGRLQPQLPLLNLAMPVKMAATVLLLASLAGAFPDVLTQAARPASQFIQSLLVRTPPAP